MLASSGNFVHPMKKISQTKSSVTKCQTCLGWIIIVCAISRGSYARMLTQNIQRRCPDMSVTVKDLLACSWHLSSSLFGISSSISCAKCRIYGVNSFEKIDTASLTTIQAMFTEWPADLGAACPCFPSSQETSRSSAWSTLQRLACKQFWTLVCSEHWLWMFEVGN